MFNGCITLMPENVLSVTVPQNRDLVSLPEHAALMCS
jgi:hypothetical protein